MNLIKHNNLSDKTIGLKMIMRRKLVFMTFYVHAILKEENTC